MKEKNESTLLHFASFKNELSKMKIYILHYEAFHKRNKHSASFESQLKAWINAQNSDGFTALHFAALHGNTEMIEFLERYGANMQAQSNEKENILFMCAENNHLRAAVYLLEHREGKIPFSVNEPNHAGDTILHKTARHGFANFTAYLLNYEGMDADARNHEGWTPLMFAVSGGHKEIVKRMLLKGVNRNLCNLEEKRAVDLAAELGKHEMARILKDEFTNCERVKIACNVKIVYEVEKPSIKQCILFLVLFHLIYLPTNLLVEVDIFGEETYLGFYALAGLFYLLVMLLYFLLTRKHPRKAAKDLLEVELPFCPECRNHIRSTEFHCFICGRCISRYDHHCPWINNCVSSYNIGKFTAFILLLILGTIEVMFLSVNFYFDALPALRPSRLIPIPEQDRDKYYLANMVVSGLLAGLFCFLLVSLLGDQLKNLCSNSTSYERAKNLSKSTLL